MDLTIEYGEDHLTIACAYDVEVKGMTGQADLLPLPSGITDSLQGPIRAKPLVEIARQKMADNPSARAVIVVSDNTRPVPYKGENGIMNPLIRSLLEAGFAQAQITVVIGAGSHRNMLPDEIEKMLGLKEAGFDEVTVTNHEYDNEDHLVYLGVTSRGSEVKVNKLYYEADLKIVTGLVESHFMAGASGGRKGICPGIVGKETLTVFHGARLLSSKQAADLVLEGNPLHDESLEVAMMAGCDFSVNVTLDAEKRITGVYSGDLQQAHREAVKKIREYVVVPLRQRYDIVIIPAGYVGINHYQAGKAAVEASRAVKPGGKILIVAKNTDTDPVGGGGYKEALRLLHTQGKKAFIEMISGGQWSMIQEQWQVQMWCKVLDVIEKPDNLIYCALEIPRLAYEYLPGIPGHQFVDKATLEAAASPEEKMKRVVEGALQAAVASYAPEMPEILLLKDGPYGIPEVSE